MELQYVCHNYCSTWVNVLSSAQLAANTTAKVQKVRSAEDKCLRTKTHAAKYQFALCRDTKWGSHQVRKRNIQPVKTLTTPVLWAACSSGPRNPVLQPAKWIHEASSKRRMRRKERRGLCSRQQRDKASQGARYGGEERSGRETANLPGACWELNLAGEISAVSERDNPSVTESSAAMIPPVFLWF